MESATGVDDPSLSTTLDTSTLGERTFVVAATDLAGNTTSQTFAYTVVDTTSPTVVITADSVGPYQVGEVVGVVCSFADPSPGSGLASFACGDVPGSTSATLDTSRVGTFTFTATATDVAGNTTDETFTFVVEDTIDPTVVITPDSAGPHEQGEVVGVTCSFADSGSGLASVACGGVTGTDEAVLSTTLDTSTPGIQTFTASATDAAGNTTTRTFTYEVVDLTCDPLGDVMNPDVDIVRCQSVANPDGTATLSIIVDGDIALTGVQYRLRLADSPNDSGRLVKWAEGKLSGRPLLSVNVTGARIDFVVNPGRVGVGPGETLYWFAEVQDGVSGQPTAGFLDRAPDEGIDWFELMV